MIKPDKSWTLFLDRDGVINKELHADYVKHIHEFIFEDGALDALKIFNTLFGTIVIVTNQRGVGAGLMSETDLENIHTFMLSKIQQHGGRIDHIFYCADTNRDSTRRKPHPYMGLQAKELFPQIDFRKAIMAGNTLPDMQFGKNLGMHTVFIDDKTHGAATKNEFSDEIFGSLADYANHLSKL